MTMKQTLQAQLEWLQPLRGLSPKSGPSFGKPKQKPELEGNNKWTKVKIWETALFVLGTLLPGSTCSHYGDRSIHHEKVTRVL